MNVLVACEESQVVMSAFLAVGVNAFSLDIQPCSGGHPERHIQCDAITFLNSCPNGFFDLIIAHPPCTYLTAVGSPWFSKDPNRKYQQLAARDFFMFFYNYNGCHRVCIENPRPRKDSCLPPYDQVVQPYDFGDNWSKQTMLWLIHLPPLFPSVIEYNRRSAAPSWVGCHSGSVQRSKFFPGIARAMANQWQY